VQVNDIGEVHASVGPGGGLSQRLPIARRPVVVVGRHSAPTAPKVTREMRPPSNRASQVRQKARTWRGRCACVL
jgi:hypothetical protein